MLANSYFWIGNGTTVLPGRACKQGSVLVKNGKILAVKRRIYFTGLYRLTRTWRWWCGFYGRNA